VKVSFLKPRRNSKTTIYEYKTLYEKAGLTEKRHTKNDSFDVRLMIRSKKILVAVICFVGCPLAILVEICQGDRKKQKGRGET
jgi:hypothetical protein